jgi:hypothetical protein
MVLIAKQKIEALGNNSSTYGKHKPQEGCEIAAAPYVVKKETSVARTWADSTARSPFFVFLTLSLSRTRTIVVCRAHEHNGNSVESRCRSKHLSPSGITGHHLQKKCK